MHIRIYDSLINLIHRKDARYISMCSGKIMEFKDFCNEIADSMPNYLLGYDIEKIKIEKVNKNNGIICTGIVIVLKDENIAPNIYLDYYFMLYRQGHNLDDILCMLRDEYLKARESMSKHNFNVEYDQIKEKVILKLVNYEKNKDMLKHHPYITFLDLAITFRYLVKQDDAGIASTIISNKDLIKWKISKDKLYEMALENTKKIFPGCIRSMDEYVKNIEEICPGFSERKRLYVLTNETGINGATSLLYGGILKSLAEEKGTNLYLLPSSIHEIIILECAETEKSALEDMVKEINKYIVAEVDFLSNSVYIYDLETDKICI